MKPMTCNALLAALVALSTCAASNSPNVPKTAYIQVYKHNGSQQCYGGGISPQAMLSELNGIQVYAAEAHSLQGVMFPAVCGGLTGNVNVYTIDAKDKSKAEKRGFKVLQEKD